MIPTIIYMSKLLADISTNWWWFCWFKHIMITDLPGMLCWFKYKLMILALKLPWINDARIWQQTNLRDTSCWYKQTNFELQSHFYPEIGERIPVTLVISNVYNTKWWFPCWYKRELIMSEFAWYLVQSPTPTRHVLRNRGTHHWNR